MKCKACDKLLTDFESSIRSQNTGEYFDLCKGCLDCIREFLPETKENFLVFDSTKDEFNIKKDISYDEIDENVESED